MKRLIFLLTTVALHAGGAAADFYQCGQVWQNKPCITSPSKSISEIKSPPPNEDRSREKALKAVKQYIWSLEGRYSPVSYASLHAAIKNCESKSVAHDQCEKELTEAAIETRKNIDQADSARADRERQERTHQDLLSIEAAKILIEKAKLEEMQRQTNELGRQTDALR